MKKTGIGVFGLNLFLFLYISFGIACAREPGSGKYCKAMSEQETCIHIDFKHEKITIQNTEYPMHKFSNSKYNFLYMQNKYSINVINQYRLKISDPPELKGTYLKAKVKKRK